MDGQLAARAVERREQQRRRRRGAQQTHRAADAINVDPIGRGDVQHRALRKRSDDLVRARQHGVRALVQRARRQVGMEAEMWPPSLVDYEWDARGVRNLGTAGDVRGHPVVGGRHDENGPCVRAGRERLAQRVGRDAVSHAELVVVLGGDERRDPAGQDEAVDDRRVRVSLRDHANAKRREGQRQRVIALGGAIGEKPRALGAVGLGRQGLGALVRCRRGTRVDAFEILRDVDRQRAVADRVA